MGDVFVTLKLDQKSLRQVYVLAKKERRPLNDEVACLLEKGIYIYEFTANQASRQRKIKED